MSIRTFASVNFMVCDFGMLALVIVALVCLWTGNWAGAGLCCYGYRIMKTKREVYRGEAAAWAKGQFGRKGR